MTRPSLVTAHQSDEDAYGGETSGDRHRVIVGGSSTMRGNSSSSSPKTT